MRQLFETIRIESGKPCHLEYHQERMDRSFYALTGRKNRICLDRIVIVPAECGSGIFKCRVTYDSKNHFIEYLAYKRRETRSLKVVEADLDYSLKFRDRSCLERLLGEKGNCDDILIARNGLLTDTSYSNIVLRSSRGLFTPAEPLLAGTAIARLIDEGTVRPCEIKVMDIFNYDSILLVNAMTEPGDIVIPVSCVDVYL